MGRTKEMSPNLAVSRNADSKYIEALNDVRLEGSNEAA